MSVRSVNGALVVYQGFGRCTSASALAVGYASLVGSCLPHAIAVVHEGRRIAAVYTVLPQLKLCDEFYC